MTDWPRLTILLLTYTEDADGPRAVYAARALRSALTGLKYSGEIHVHIADDGSPKLHRDRLVEIAGGYDHVHTVGVSNAERSGYGASYNLATQSVHQGDVHGIILPLEDDWELGPWITPFDVDGLVLALLTGSIGCIRMGYLGFTEALRCTIQDVAGTRFLVFDPESPERHISAGHPRLETVAWERAVGPWEEGVDPGTTEFLWCGAPNARKGVAWPLHTHPGGTFVHFGTIQARHDQMEVQ